MTDTNGTPWPEGYGRIILDAVGSTQDAAYEMAGREPGCFWVMARRQTSARGRRGRTWHMAEGNFAATLLLRLDEPPGRAALRSFAMSLALLRAVSEMPGTAGQLALKWPNDVLLNGGKLAGILLENRARIGLAIGVGVNLATAPAPETVEPGAVRPVALADVTGETIRPEVFLQTLAHHYAVLERQFRDYGFDPIRTGWLAHAARLGDVITARVGQQLRSGIFQDVDADGHLVLRGPDGPETIAAADVHF
jgi:BirA family biotin operon repressor/biotin-[acetyl-CoA-carboxylase] ligase